MKTALVVFCQHSGNVFGGLIAAWITLLAATWGQAAEAPATGPKIVLIAGPITGHGKNTHEYEKNVILLKHLLETSPNVKGVRVEAHFQGWPQDPLTLDDAATIVMISDGGDHRESDHPFYVGERFEVLKKQMARGCGLVNFHWTTFHPSRVHQEITEWVGGYFDYQTGNTPNKWFSAISTWEGPTTLGTPAHPILRGVKPFTLQEEFYYRIKFRDNDERLQPILLTRPPGGKSDEVVGWAVERKDGGRGFGFTGGHFYKNWWLPDFRRMVLNAILWTAKVEVPTAGVESTLEEPVRLLIVTGHNHPAHDWRKVTEALIPVLEQDPRVEVVVTENPEDLALPDLSRYAGVVFNYSSWDRPGLSDAAKQNFVKYLANGGGLSIIHFANGSYTNTIPNKESDWPEFRTQIVRRIWDHGTGLSGHDAFGDFRVQITAAGAMHPITKGMPDFDTTDELYFRQQGPLPILPLATAHSKVTKADEPMAWAYDYKGARVFQTVLGHGDVSIRKAGILIRRGTIWTTKVPSLSWDPPTELTEKTLFRAGSQWTRAESLKKVGLTLNSQDGPAATPKKNTDPLVPAKFGKGLNAFGGGAHVKGRAEYRQPPLTVEAWCKLPDPKPYNILVANETKASATHWELFTMAGNGELTVYLPGYTPDHVRSTAKICDDQWHAVGLVFEPARIRLFVDGKQVADQAVKFNGGSTVEGGFALGSLVEQAIGCQGVLDEVRISKGIREIREVPSKPFEADETTLGLWHLDELDAEKRFPDASSLKAPATTALDEKKKRGPLKIISVKPSSASNGPSRTGSMTAGS